MEKRQRTFQSETEVYKIHEWINQQIETHQRPVVFGGSEPSEEYVVETDYKYIVTVTKVETLID